MMQSLRKLRLKNKLRNKHPFLRTVFRHTYMYPALAISGYLLKYKINS